MASVPAFTTCKSIGCLPRVLIQSLLRVFEWGSFHQGWVRGLVELLLGCSPEAQCNDTQWLHWHTTNKLGPGSQAEWLFPAHYWKPLYPASTHLDTTGHYECVHTMFTYAPLALSSYANRAARLLVFPRQEMWNWWLLHKISMYLQM